MPVPTTRPCIPCEGTGLIGGQPDPHCGGTGVMALDSGPADIHGQTKWNLIYTLEEVDKHTDKLDALDTKMDVLETHLDAIEAKIDQLLP